MRIILGCVSCVGLINELAGEKKNVTVRLREPSTIPIEADSICPDLFVHRNHEEIKALPVFYGRREMKLGELFAVDGEKSDTIVVEGALGHVKKIGLRMSQGHITVMSDVGPHLGAFMKGGEIVVQGNAGDWAGAHMHGGTHLDQRKCGAPYGSGLPR